MADTVIRHGVILRNDKNNDVAIRLTADNHIDSTTWERLKNILMTAVNIELGHGSPEDFVENWNEVGS